MHTREEGPIEKGKMVLKGALALGFIVMVVWAIIPGGGRESFVPLKDPDKEEIIGSFRMGAITIEDETYYDTDVIIFPNRVKYNWYGLRGHELLPEEVEDVALSAARTVIIGTGTEGAARVMPATLKFLESKGKTVHIMNSWEAVKLFNRSPKADLVGIFHITN